MYTVYLHTNKITGKKYVGMTCQIPWTRRFNGDGSGYKGCRYFWSAINKYGWENFEHQILDIFEKEEDAMECEKYYIELFNTTNREYGYNIKTGGQHQHFPEEIKENTRKANAGRATRGSGWQHSEETKEKIRSAQKGRRFTPEHAANVRKATQEYYKTHSPAHTFTKEDHDNAMNARRKKIRIVETGQVFISVRECAEYLGICDSNLSKYIKRGYYKDIHFERVCS